MVWKPVRAGRDHLGQFSKVTPVDALAELIWNGLDAEADVVDVVIETASFGDDALTYVERVVVTDNGHGMSHQRADSAFESLGDSWKKLLNGRTVNSRRALHGRQGRGRFGVYAIGHRARWSSVSASDNGPVQVVITGEQERIDGFMVDDPVPAPGSRPGTTVTVDVEQGRLLPSLLRDDLPLQITARLAGHLLANDDIVVTVNGHRLDPRPLIDGAPTDIPLDALPADRLDGRETPVLTVVDWTDEMKRPPGLVLCNGSGMALVQLDKPAPPVAVKSTGYLKWSGFSDSGADLTLAGVHHPDILREATRLYEHHVKKRFGLATAGIVARLVDEGLYPYAGADLDDPIVRTERDMFDLVAVTARSTLATGTRQQREMNVRLIKLALEERPETLDRILAETLDLSTEDQHQLSDMLSHSSLGRIVGAASEVTRRIDLLSTLRHCIYGQDVADRMREVDQLHPLIKDNCWIFGEEWNLSRSEASLTTVLRDTIGAGAVLETQLANAGGRVLLDDGRAGRVDLVLLRTIRHLKQTVRLVVELKRPRVVIGDKELRQIRGYAKALSKHSGTSKWLFLLVGSSIDDEEIGDQIYQAERERGLAVHNDHYEVRVTTWADLLDQAEIRLDFYRDQLEYDISQEEAVERVRQRHADLIPSEPNGTAADDPVAS